MKQQRKTEWTRLDNASKIFPATCNHKDTKVFRITCELYEAVEPERLQQALNRTIQSFPLYKSVLRRGFFWYYFENVDTEPVVEEETNPVCAPIYFRDKRNLLFRVFYYSNRINFEIFHALSDGTGALWFMQTLVHNYLVFCYGDKFAGKAPKLDYNVSISKKTDDSFRRYSIGKGILLKELKNGKGENEKSYHIKGTRNEENRMRLIEGSMSVKAVLEQARKYNTTLTIFFTSLFIYAIYQEMPAPMKKHPVALSVPINLRQFFESATARNFFSTMQITYQFGKEGSNFEDIICGVRECFRGELTEEQINRKLNRFVSLEKNILTRVVPLSIKDYLLRVARIVSDRKITAALSNMGTISMPAEFEPYIKQFGISTSARRPQIGICSYRDRLVVSFTSPFQETDIQRNFFQFLAQLGVELEIASNL